MIRGLFRGPLSVLIVAGAAILIYKYVPFDEIVERFRNDGAEAPTAAVAPQMPPGASRPGSPVVAPTPVTAPIRPIAADTASVLGDQPGDRSPNAPATAHKPSSNGAVARQPTAPTATPAVPTPPTLPAPAELPASPAPASAPPPAAPKTPDRAAESLARSAPAVHGKPRPSAPAPLERIGTVERPARVAPPPASPVVTAPAAPALRVLVEADNHALAGLDKYTPEEYATLLRTELVAVLRGSLGSDGGPVAPQDQAFRDALRAGRDGVDRLCERVAADRLVLADVTVPAAGFSTIESAYWPEVVFTAINCRDGRLLKTTKTRLEPHALDRFDYQRGFGEAAQRFVASQAYFLQP